MTLPQYILYSVLGICVVFAALVLLMLIVKLVSLIPEKSEESANGNPSSAESGKAVLAVSAEDRQLAPGSAGNLKLYDTDPRDAAMIMAIVADELGKPLNELRFLSIKEVKR